MGLNNWTVFDQQRANSGKLYYAGLGAQGMISRVIIEDDGKAGTAPVEFISHRYRHNRFNLESAVVGKRIKVNKTPVSINEKLSARRKRIYRLLPTASRSARLAMTMANSAGSTGLATCIRKPAARAFKRSSDRPSAVRAMAGI